MMKSGFRFSAVVLFLLCLVITVKAQDVLHYPPPKMDEDDKPQVILKNWELFLVSNANEDISSQTPLKVKRSFEDSDSLDLSNYKGYIVYRKKFTVDSGFLNRSPMLVFRINGAADIYLNGKKIRKLGEIGDAENEHLFYTGRKYVHVNLQPGQAYELLIRFSNHRIHSKSGDYFGVQVALEDADEGVYRLWHDQTQNIGLLTLIMAGFLTLAVLHIIIYLFNRDQKGNIYYSLFCILLALIFFTNSSERFFSSLTPVLVTEYMRSMTLLFIFSILPFMFRAIFHFKIPRWYKFIIFFSILTLLLDHFDFDIIFYMYVAVVAIGVIESVRIIFIAFREKKKGARIIGAGLVFFLSLVLLFVSAMIFNFNINVKGGIGGLFLLFGLLLCIFSIPISITVFLAYSISLTNQSLAKKLTEVEELSAKSLEQEKEKQSILANQNQVLEQQVTERTQEIREQKKVIEEKNKDIIDSINYAKRIQAAMLPDEASFKSIFGNSFVLYQPRDIVSGDFYYATELNGRKIVLAADCTGHGVPGALMSMVGSNIINKLVHENEVTQPKLLLEKLHEQLRHALKQDQKGSMNRDGMDAAVLMFENEKIHYAGANRPIIYFDREGQLFEIKPSKTPVGGSHIEKISVDEHVLEKNNISQLYLFSDGFADQFGGPAGKKLMVSKFKTWLNEISALNCGEQLKFLSEHFDEWKKNTEQVDDVMVIGIRV